MADGDAALAAQLASARSAAGQSGAAAVALVRKQLRDSATPDGAALAYFSTMTGHTHQVRADSQDKIGRMAQALSQAMQQLAGMLREIKSSGDSVGMASAQIAAANADLSVRTGHTAANLQQVASSMEQLHVAVRQNAESALQATRLAGRSSSVAAVGGAAWSARWWPPCRTSAAARARSATSSV